MTEKQASIKYLENAGERIKERIKSQSEGFIKNQGTLDTILTRQILEKAKEYNVRCILIS